MSMKEYYKYAALYNFSYMSIGAFLPFIGQYMKHIGFSGTQIGMITASGTAVAIFASTFWGKRYSVSMRRYIILIFLCAMAALSCFALGRVYEYGVFLAIFAFMYFFQAPVMSLTDAFTMESEQGFGGLRAWGAVGFAFGNLLAGIGTDVIGIRIIFFFYISSFVLAAVSVYLIKRKRTSVSVKNADGEKIKGGYIKVLSCSRLRKLIICAFFMGGTNVANNTYFSFLYIEGGGTVAGVGTAMFLMVGSEIPFMAWCERLSKKFTMEKLILISMTVSFVRFILFGFGPPWWMLVLLAFSQGAVNGILLIEFVRYASGLVRKEYGSLAISSYYIIGSNLSTICCQAVGGVILDVYGAAGVYMFFGLFNLCGVVLYIRFKLYVKEDKK